MYLTDYEIAQLITKEFREKSLGVTEQYLDIHQPVFEKGDIKIDRIDRENKDDIIIAYLPVKDEYFYFAVYIDVARSEIFNIGTESRNTVSLCTTSHLDLTNLHRLKNITPSTIFGKGDLKPNKKATQKYSLIEYELNPEPDEFEDKLRKLLAILLSNKDDLIKIMLQADVSIRVCMDFHRGNQLLGGAKINIESLKIMADLNLPIFFDFAAWGNGF